MLAPRFRACEQALALIVRAGRMAPGGADPDVLTRPRRASPRRRPGIRHGSSSVSARRRELLGLPPFGALGRRVGLGRRRGRRPVARRCPGRRRRGRSLPRAGAEWTTLGARSTPPSAPPAPAFGSKSTRPHLNQRADRPHRTVMPPGRMRSPIQDRLLLRWSRTGLCSDWGLKSTRFASSSTRTLCPAGQWKRSPTERTSVAPSP